MASEVYQGGLILQRPVYAGFGGRHPLCLASIDRLLETDDLPQILGVIAEPGEDDQLQADVQATGW